LPTFAVTDFTRRCRQSREKEKEQCGSAGRNTKDSPYQHEDSKSVTNLPNRARKQITASVLPTFTKQWTELSPQDCVSADPNIARWQVMNVSVAHIYTPTPSFPLERTTPFSCWQQCNLLWQTWVVKS